MTSGRQASHPWFVAEEPPIFGFRFPADMDDAALEAYCAWFSAWYAQQRHAVGMICDLSQASRVTARQRAIWAEFEKRNEAELKRVLRGVAIVAPNSLVRGIVTAAYWMNTPVYPWQVVASWEQGRDWVQARLRF